MPEPLAYIVLAATALVLLFLLPFASHRTYLLWLSRTRCPPPHPERWEGELPRVTVQLPIYNEVAVVERLLDAACRLQYPREKLEIQLLDDSTDRTTEVAAERIRRWRERGVSVRHLRRPTREGYKAGALAYGLERTDGEFVVVLDADFVPSRNLLHELLPPFQDPGVGMVQARWDHLNEDRGWLTRAQAFLLDGHFFFEQGGRHAAGRFFNFNGTAGMWRRSCMEEAGGWESDTLTEDLDLSYRAQMQGWRFVFLEDVGVPAELPETVAALEVQQRRWAQGGIQTARKLLPDLHRGPWPRAIKLEGIVHLLGYLAAPLTLALGLLLLPSAVARRSLGLEHLLGLDLLIFAAATLPFVAFYGAAGRRRGRSWKIVVPGVLASLSVGIGLTGSITRAVFRGFRGDRDPFLRTPKSGDRESGAYRAAAVPVDTILKLLLGGVMGFYLVAAVAVGYWGSIPFILLFASGWLGLGLRDVLRTLSSPSGGQRSVALPTGGGGSGPPASRPDLEGLRPLSGLSVGSRDSKVAGEFEAA